MTYSEKLKDSRWQKKRLELLEAAGWKCQSEICDSPPNSTLAIHHKLYLRKVQLWDYENWGYEVLCERCHERQQSEMESAHSYLAKYPDLQFACATMSDLSPEVADKAVRLFYQVMTIGSEVNEPLIDILLGSITTFETSFRIGWRLGYGHGEASKSKGVNA